jgi:hypothetical protein
VLKKIEFRESAGAEVIQELRAGILRGWAMTMFRAVIKERAQADRRTRR